MKYIDHNFIEITQQTKLRVALVVSNQLSSTCRARRAHRIEPVELSCSTMSTQPKCMGSTRRTGRVEPSGIWALVAQFCCSFCNRWLATKMKRRYQKHKVHFFLFCF